MSASASSGSTLATSTTLDIPVLSGRGFTDRDRAGAPRVVVVNEALAGRLAERFGMADPVGQIGRLTAPAYENRGQLGRQENVEIVGVIRNERVKGLQTRRARGRLCAVGPGAAARDQAHRADAGRRRGRDAGHPRGRAARSIRISRWATCAR